MNQWWFGLVVLFGCQHVVLGHAVSLSTGDLTIQGRRATYELRLPTYEAAHIPEPARDLFRHVSFSEGGSSARIVQQACRGEQQDASFRCTAVYEFEAEPESVDVRCTFTEITVPNHVHVLRAVKAGAEDQAVFDMTFQNATLNFQPPSPAFQALAEIAGGAVRGAAGAAQILLLVALVLAGRSRRELAALAVCWIISQAIVAVAVPWTGWYPAPRFVEAAAALSVAYLAVEILFFPTAAYRWAVVSVLGAIHGLYLALLLQTTGLHAAYLLAGAALAQLALIGVFAIVWRFISKAAGQLQPARIASLLLLVTGLGWFVVRLRS
jgi:hypothetical protein